MPVKPRWPYPTDIKNVALDYPTDAQADQPLEKKRTLVVHVDPAIYRHFKILAATLGATSDAMLHQAIELLFAEYNELGTLRRREADDLDH